MFTLKTISTRPLIRTKAQKNDEFIQPTDAPGEGKRRFPSMDEPEEKVVMNPIKRFLMNVFNIKEIDHEKFRKENKWAIKPLQRD